MLKKNLILIFGITLLSSILFVNSYTIPTYNDINFTLCTPYTAPTYSSINFTLGETEPCENVLNQCAVLNDDEWYIPVGCVCYIETQETEMYLNFDNIACSYE